METFASWIKEGRQKLGLSKTALAKTLGVHISSITYWEDGKKEPLGKNLLALAKLFHSINILENTDMAKAPAKGGKGPIQNLTSGKGGKKNPVAAPAMKGKKGGRGC